MQMYGTYMGKKLYGTTAITKSVQRRTHRKNRINKKWRKRYGYKDIPDNTKIVMRGGEIFATPKLCERIIAEIMKRQGQDSVFHDNGVTHRLPLPKLPK